jgi:outer membrane protein assembly factor BamB
MSKNKIAIAFALFLMFAMTFSLVALPAANAHTPAWKIPTYAFISVQPNPVGAGQEAFVNFWIDKVVPTANGAYGDRWHGFAVTVTDPSGNKETLGPFTSDDAGGAHTTYTPKTVGNYTFVFNFPGQTITGENPAPGGFIFNSQQVGDIYEASTSRTVTLVVQDESVLPYPSTPLPTDYWTRPIFAENTNWYTISGNWLGAGSYNATTNFNPYTTAPSTSHVVWTQQYAPGGLIGGDYGGSEVNSNYYSTAQYETKFAPIIMNGVLYYTKVPGSQTSPEGWTAVDLRTGQTLWTYTPPPSIPGPGASGAVFASPNATTLLRGQILDFVSPNQYGGLEYLWTNEPTVSPNTGSTYGMYDAMTGNWILDIVNGTGATFVPDTGGLGTQGSMIGYYINTTYAIPGNPYSPVTGMYLTMWNSTRCILRGPTGTGDLKNWLWRPLQGSSIPWEYGIQWSVPITTTMTASNGTVVDINKAYAESAGVASNIAISRIGDVILVTDIPGPTISFQQPGYIIAEAYDLQTGKLLWGPLNQTQTPWCRLSLSAVGEGVYTIFTYETQTYTAYSQATGDKLWTASTANAENPWGYYVTSAMIGYGNLYSSDFGGYVNCFDVKTGDLKWTFWTGSSGYENPYGVWPLVNFECIADGKIYVMGGHLYSPPLFHGGNLYCINATSGDLLWSSPSFPITNGANCAVADGYLVVPNAYNNELFAYGKGRSATTIAVSPKISVHGDSVLVEGTVTDQSPGQTCLGIPAAGTPAISDDSMSAWMEYLYMEQPKPTNATGVKVTITVLDPNNNCYDVGTATSDIDGFFKLTFTPQVPGAYNVYATFTGSESYYGSSALTAINVEEAPAATAPPTAPPASLADIYFLPMSIVLLIAIIVVGIAMVLMFRRR